MCLKWEDEWLACLSSLRFWDLTSFLPPFSSTEPSWSGTSAQFLDGGDAVRLALSCFQGLLTVSEINLLSDFVYFSYCFDCSYLCFYALLSSPPPSLCDFKIRSKQGVTCFPSSWSLNLKHNSVIHWFCSLNLQRWLVNLINIAADK